MTEEERAKAADEAVDNIVTEILAENLAEGWGVPLKKPKKEVFFVNLTHPISETEKSLLSSGITVFEFVEYTKPHGYIKVKDDQGYVWICHPEAFKELRD
jgi:hypothetical protein